MSREDSGSPKVTQLDVTSVDLDLVSLLCASGSFL